MDKLVVYAERLFLIVLSGGVVMRLWPSLAEHPEFSLFLFSELLGVFLILTQRRGSWTTEAFPIIIALIGTGAALLVMPQGTALAPAAVSATLFFVGGFIALLAKLSLGRSFGLVPANRGVKRGGIYRFVRHPMYFGYMMNHLGFLLAFFSLWNVVIYAIAWYCLWLRAREEEKFLLRDEAYVAYASDVRFRLVPGIL